MSQKLGNRILKVNKGFLDFKQNINYIKKILVY